MKIVKLLPLPRTCLICVLDPDFVVHEERRLLPSALFFTLFFVIIDFLLTTQSTADSAGCSGIRLVRPKVQPSLPAQLRVRRGGQ